MVICQWLLTIGLDLAICEWLLAIEYCKTFPNMISDVLAIRNGGGVRKSPQRDSFGTKPTLKYMKYNFRAKTKLQTPLLKRRELRNNMASAEATLWLIRKISNWKENVLEDGSVLPFGKPSHRTCW